jgi:hypothetical protein
MADQPPPQLLTEGAIPRVGMSIPMPASTKPPPPAPSAQQSTKPQAQS